MRKVRKAKKSDLLQSSSSSQLRTYRSGEAKVAHLYKLKTINAMDSPKYERKCDKLRHTLLMKEKILAKLAKPLHKRIKAKVIEQKQGKKRSPARKPVSDLPRAEVNGSRPAKLFSDKLIKSKLKAAIGQNILRG